MDFEIVGKNIVHCAIKVHSNLGPGLLESTYQKCLAHELENLGHNVQCELIVPIQYASITIQSGYRIDMLVDNCVIVENKTVENIQPVHKAQLLTYLKMKNIPLGYILNWYVNLMKHGIKRMINTSPRQG